ncbi:multidrug resistance protein [Penicillium malachiteum]|uniref:multidrug resistance protein n=1 Tax=Penicillium malachiteum TaxID=1324776 RepID=UPI002546BF99|nr:multidrug resistance protein [Penicillium malachiteum]KAJ5714841.1 multidrug resistance protein [Penicillium malachiteum]
MISIVSVSTLMTALGSTIPTPGVPQLMKEFHSDNDLLERFVISVYALGFAFGPLVIAPLSETYGRLPVCLTCNLNFLIWCIACAIAPNMAALVIFRFLAGAFGAAPFTLGGGTIADIVDPAQRGTAMGIWMGGLTVGPVIGPTFGGFISAYLGWRWTFWILSIIAGVICGISIIFMRETFARVLLARKVQQLRKESGNPDLKSRLDKEDSTAILLRLSFIRPAKMFFKSVMRVSTLHLCCYCLHYDVHGQYGIPTSTSGLVYLGWGIGSIIGQATYTTVSNRFVARSIAKGTFKPEDRLPLIVPGGILLPIGLIWYGWSAQAEVHWIVPIIGTAVAAIGLTIVFVPVALRSLCAAVIPLRGQTLYDKLGIGWGNTLLALVVLGCIPITLVFYFYGERIRKRYPLVNL